MSHVSGNVTSADSSIQTCFILNNQILMCIQEEGKLYCVKKVAAAADEMAALSPPSSVSADPLQTSRERSVNLGVSLRFLLSEEFLCLAMLAALASKQGGTTRYDGSELDESDPSFYDIKDSLALGDGALGASTVCPRDRQRGSSIVDWLDQKIPGDAGEATDFLSWTWATKVREMQSALRYWHKVNADKDQRTTFIWICFFCNNQNRMIDNADNLEEVFSNRLQHITNRGGGMIALLDNLHDPVYTKRSWCIFEQYTAHNIPGLSVKFVCSEEQIEAAVRDVRLLEIKAKISELDVEKAEATEPSDAKKDSPGPALA